MRTSKWLSLSILVHGLLLLSVWKVHKPEEISKELNRIEFEVQNAAPKNMTVAEHKNGHDKAGKRSGGKEVSLKGADLFGSNYALHSKALNTDIESTNTPNFSDRDTYQFDSGNFLGSNDQWEFYHQVFERIDNELIFDSILAQYNHFGDVFVEFEVDAEGHFVDKRLKVSANDSILKVHAMRAVRRGLKETFKKEKWNPSGKSSILQAHFEFLQGDSSINLKKQKLFGKPVFVFKRATSEKPVTNNLTETLISAETIANPYLIGERLEKYNKKKRLRAGEFDPFATYRNDPDYNL